MNDLTNADNPSTSLIAVLSPAFDSLLARTFSSADRPAIDTTFEYAWRNGGDSELDIYRGEGVTFNPRIARIAQLGIIEGKIIDAEILCALLLSIPPQPHLIMPPFASERTKHIAFQSRALVSGTSPLSSVGPEGIIVAAIVLDRVRHLHLSPNTLEQRQQELSTLEKTIDPLLSLKHISIFKDKITTAARRFNLARHSRYTPLSSFEES